MIKKYSLIAFLLILIGCEKDFNNVVDVGTNSYQVVSIPTPTNFRYIPGDSTITISISLRNNDLVKSVFVNIYSSANIKLNGSPLLLLDNGNIANGDLVRNDNTFSNRFPLSQSFPNGRYRIEYYITDVIDITKQSGISNFIYDNGQSNVPPVISNLVMPDSIQLDVQFLMSVDVSDSNGTSDILEVFYELFRPDGTKITNSQGISEFPLFDTGINGDAVANDQKYSVFLTFPSSSNPPKGGWRFEFSARDRSRTLSNKIIHLLELI